MFIKPIQWLTTLLLLVLSGAIWATEPYQEWDKRIEHGELANGLRYFLYNSESESDPFNIRLIVHAGSVDEPQVKGIAHAVEHMVFNQTQAHPLGVQAYVAELGWRIGKEINAKTRATETQYMIRTRPDDALDIQASLAMLADMMGSARLTQEEWLREQNIITAEKRLTSSLVDRISQQIKKATLSHSKYSENPVIGSYESIQDISVEDIRQFYHRYYVASNMTLIISGHFDTDQTRKLIEDSLGRLPRAPKPDRAYVNYPLEPQIQRHLVQDPQGSSSKTALGFRIAIADKSSREGLQLRLENYLIRKLLTKQIQRNAGYLPESVTSVSAVIKEPANQRLTLAFAARTQDHDQGLKAILLEAERLKKYGFDALAFQEQLERAKHISERNIQLAKQRTFAEWEDKITNAVLSGGVLAAPSDVHALNMEMLNQVTLARLNARLKAFLESQDVFIYYQAPGSVELTLPSIASVERWQRQAKAAEVLKPVAYVPQPKPEALTTSDMTPVTGFDLKKPMPNVLPQPDTVYAAQSVYEWRLKNGNRLVWLNRPTPDGKVYLKAISNVGAQSKQFPNWLAQSAIQIFEQTAPDGIDFVAWKNWGSANGVDWKFKLQDHHLDMSTVVEPDKLDNALLAFWYHHQNRRFPADATEAVEESGQALLERDESDSLYKLRYGADTSFIVPTKDDLRTLTPETLSQTAQRLIQQPHQLFMVGSLDKDKVEALGGQFLASIENQAPMDAHSVLQRDGEHKFVRHRTGPVQTQVTIYGQRPMTWTPEDAFTLSTLNPIAQQALRKRLRLELGAVYKVGFEMEWDSALNQVEYELTFTARPEQADSLALEAQSVLHSLPSAIADANLVRIKQDIDYAEQNRLDAPTTWLNRLMLSYRAYQDPRYLNSMKTMSEQVTEQKLTALARQVFSTSNIVQINTLMQPDTAIAVAE